MRKEQQDFESAFKPVDRFVVRLIELTSERADVVQITLTAYNRIRPPDRQGVVEDFYAWAQEALEYLGEIEEVETPLDCLLDSNVPDDGADTIEQFGQVVPRATSLLLTANRDMKLAVRVMQERINAGRVNLEMAELEKRRFQRLEKGQYRSAEEVRDMGRQI